MEASSGPHRHGKRNPWGAPSAPNVPVNLHDVMDEELAVKLQREEEEQWAREMAMATQYQADDRKKGWCFVEVPSADCEYGTVSVMEQEISLDEDDDGNESDSDFALAMELQAQEADEYDRLRRQEASSIERIQLIQQEHPKQHQLCDYLGSAGGPKQRRSKGSWFGGLGNVRHSSTLSHSHSHGSIQSLGASASGLSSSRTRPRTPLFSSSGRLSYSMEGDDKDHATPSSETATSATSATFDDDDVDDAQDDDDDLYLEDDCGLPIRKFNSLHLSLRSLSLHLDDPTLDAKISVNTNRYPQPPSDSLSHHRVGVKVHQF